MGSALLLPVLAAVAQAAAGAPAGVRLAERAESCPSTAQLHDSLEARLPGVVREAGGGRQLIELRLADETPPATGLRLQLVDGGGVVLERTLRQPGAVRSDDATCAALADTVALIVARFLREIGYEGPPAREPPPARPPQPAAVIAAPAPPASPPSLWGGFVGLGAAGRVGLGGSARPPRPELSLSLGLARGRLALAFAGGVAAEATTTIPDAAGGLFRLREYPLRAASGALFELGGGALLAGLAIGASVLSFSSTGIAGAVDDHAVELSGEGVCQYGRPLLGPVGLRVGLGIGVIAAPRDFDAGGREPVFATPRGYVRAELGLGVSFGKF